MKSHCFSRRLLTLILAAAMLISDQTILYAAQTSDIQDSSQLTDPEVQSSPGQTNTELDTETPFENDTALQEP